MHSKLQINASSAGGTLAPHFSHSFFISRAIDSDQCGKLRATKMHKTNSILMLAPKQTVFETAANLEFWPKILPHYRYIHYLERGPDPNVVVMAARRFGDPD